MDKKKAKIPALRFPEFEGEWEKKKLGLLINKMHSGVSRKLSDTDIGLPILRSNNLDECGLNVSNIKYWYLKDNKGVNLENYYLKSGDLLVNFINSVAQIGKFALFENILNRDTIFTTNLMRLSFKGNVSYYFVYYYFHLKKYSDYIQSITKPAVNQASFTTKDFQNFQLFIPTLPEQQKIADFLSAVDDKINTLTRKKTLLQQFKKGVMQQIFSQEIRFPEFDDEWEEKKFGEIYSFHPTNSLSRDKLNYSKGKVKNIHYGDIHTKFSTIFIINEEDVPFINEDINLNKITTDSYCKVGDLVVADASEDYIDIGKTIELKFLEDEKLLAGLHTFLARPQKKCMAIGFAGYLMQTWPVRKQLMTIAQGIKVLSLSKNRLAQISIILPSLPEQQKIADFLGGIDKKIELVNSQLEKIKEWKKGLLQQMFV